MIYNVKIKYEIAGKKAEYHGFFQAQSLSGAAKFAEEYAARRPEIEVTEIIVKGGNHGR